MVLESKEKSKHISYDDSSLFLGLKCYGRGNFEIGARHQSNHFSTLCLMDVMRIHPPKQIMDCEEEYHPYIF